jgi:hypothetical protein
MPTFEELQDSGRFAAGKNQPIKANQFLAFAHLNRDGPNFRQCFGVSCVIPLNRQDTDSRPFGFRVQSLNLLYLQCLIRKQRNLLSSRPQMLLMQ